MKTKKDSGFSNFWSIVVLVFLLLIIGLLIWFIWPYYLQNGIIKMINNRKNISGTLDLNGPIPTGAQLVITKKEIGTTNAEKSQIVISPVDEQNFVIESKAGKSYEIDAKLVQSSGETTVSEPSYVTAPAKSESIRINFTDVNRPTTMTAASEILGKVKINGYIPNGAYVSVEAKTKDQSNFIVITDNTPAMTEIPIEFSEAIENQIYQIRSKMYDLNGNIIGKSDILEVAAPAKNEEMIINSTASAPSTSVTINGFVTLNGNTPPNSSVVIYWRKSGNGEFTTAIDGVNAVDGTKWSIKNATQGVTYEMFAVLKQKEDNKDKDIAGSGVQLVSAPANNIFFKINSGFQLPGAVGTISINCRRRDSVSNKWDATVSFQSILGAKAYWLEVGGTGNWNDSLNQKTLAVGTSYQTADVNISDSVIYYSRYAFNNTGSFEDSSFSPFSGVKDLKCPP